MAFEKFLKSSISQNCQEKEHVGISGPCILTPICRSFFLSFFLQSSVCFDDLVWSSVSLCLRLCLSCVTTWYFLLPCHAVLFLPISTHSSVVEQKSNCFSSMSWMGVFFLSCLYRSVLSQITLFLLGSVFQIILSCRCPQSLRSLCSFSLPSPLLFPSELCLCSQLDFSCGTQLAKCYLIANVCSATVVSIYFVCLQALISFASAPLFVAHCLLAFPVTVLIFKPFPMFVLQPDLMPADNSGSHPDPSALVVIDFFSLLFLCQANAELKSGIPWHMISLSHIQIHSGKKAFKSSQHFPN